MEFQFGEFEQALANFETILETYPAKYNIWLIYVDQLVKKGRVEVARYNDLVFNVPILFTQKITGRFLREL